MSRRRRLGNRRGFTLILTAFMFTALIGIAAFAVDFGEMYLFRAQLHTASDAAALAGAQRIMEGQSDQALDTALIYAAKHSVNHTTVSLVSADVIPGTWTYAGGFVPTPGGDWSTANAVQTTTRYTAPYQFGRIMGFTSKDLIATSQAVSGSVGATTCVKPVAIPYQSLLDQIYPAGGPAGTKDPSWNLTDDDIAKLQGDHPSVQLKLGSDATQGNFYLINMGPYQYANGSYGSPNWGGDPIFVDRFARNGTCTMTVGPGDWLQGKTGEANGPTEQGFEGLCSVSVGGPAGTYPCSTDIRIKVALWGQEDDSHCTPRCFLVKYTGVFVVTAYTKENGAGAQDGVWGYFTDMPSDGAFSTVPSPLKKIALVK